MDNNKTTSAELLQQALEAERVKNEKLLQDNAALVAEFDKADTYEEQLAVAKEAIKDILPEAIRTINELIVSADSEGVRASLSKYVLDVVLTNKLDKSSDKSIEDLIKNLTETPAPTDGTAQQ